MKKSLVLGILLVLTSTTYAADAAKPSKEDRQKMADMHMKMADCLKSNKPMSECHKEMMSDKKTMQMMMENGGCPMMEGGHMKGSMMQGQGMMGHDSDKKQEDNK